MKNQKKSFKILFILITLIAVITTGTSIKRIFFNLPTYNNVLFPSTSLSSQIEKGLNKSINPNSFYLVSEFYRDLNLLFKGILLSLISLSFGFKFNFSKFFINLFIVLIIIEKIFLKTIIKFYIFQKKLEFSLFLSVPLLVYSLLCIGIYFFLRKFKSFLKINEIKPAGRVLFLVMVLTLFPITMSYAKHTEFENLSQKRIHEINERLEKQFNSLEIGMIKKDVIAKIGLPSEINKKSDNSERWNYIYYFNKSNHEVSEFFLKIIFKNDVILNFEYSFSINTF
jgi:outer membrane protein assembly factor BamE (lipoprotein component of BamABCDE complex)